MNLTIKLVAHNSEEYRDTVKLREQILRKPLSLTFAQEELDRESSSFHVAGYGDGQLVGCLVLKPAEERNLQMRQVAVADAMQGKGIGKALVLFAEDFGSLHGYEQMVLHARETAVPFYLKLAYETIGDVYEEVTLPHRTMCKRLSPLKHGTAPSAADEAIITNSVQLRELEESDLETLFIQQIDTSANHMAAFTAKNPADREDFATRWANILSDEAILRRAVISHGQVAGSILSFRRGDKQEVCYWYGKEYWGRGIATEALRQFLQIQKLRPLHARAAKDNLASIRILEKCGFTIVGYESGFANARNQLIEEVLMELT